MTLELYIDPTPEAGGASSFVPLFRKSGEYHQTLQGLGRSTWLSAALPDSLFLEIYAYEALERMRDLLRQRMPSGTVFWMPFWPSCLFSAAGITAHPANELQGMFPCFARTSLVTRSEEDCLSAAKVWLGAQDFLPHQYLDCLREQAVASDWEIVAS